MMMNAATAPATARIATTAKIRASLPPFLGASRSDALIACEPPGTGVYESGGCGMGPGACGMGYTPEPGTGAVGGRPWP
jgi:hypothetical protein